MEPSPLTQDARPDYFQPKIVQLYEQLLLHDDDTFFPSEGFWREFFLLRPDKSALIKLLNSISPEELLHLHPSTQNLFDRAIQEAQSGRSPQNSHAFETLTAFLGGVLTKKYTNPSSDVIEVLAGLDEVDHQIPALINSIDSITKGNGDASLKRSAIDTAIAMISGAYQTGLVSYFMDKDLFPALMKFVHDCENANECYGPLVLLGLLSNYNKFEMQNPYQLRLDDFVNESIINQIVQYVGSAFTAIRNEYVVVQDDLPEGWNLNSTLVFIGLRAFAPEPKSKVVPPTETEAKEMFGSLPGNEAALLLSTYSFVNANKLFANKLVLSPATSKSTESPFSSFLSLTSYLGHHAHRSERCLHYTLLSLFTLRIITEDSIIMKRISSSDAKIPVRLCRQRAPHLPMVASDRVPLTAILDICTTILSHNLRKRLDIPLYSQAIGIILRIITFLSRNKIRLAYHWSYIWGSLISLIRFLTQYSSELTYLPYIRDDLCIPLTNLTAFCLSAGESFLPDNSSYEDLLYKLVGAGPTVTKFRDAYNLTHDAATSALIQCASHYQSLLEKTNKTHQSPHEVATVIKEGYDSLDISETTEKSGLGGWTTWREITSKALLKRIGRTSVEDAKNWVIEK